MAFWYRNFEFDCSTRRSGLDLHGSAQLPDTLAHSEYPDS
jgi:hypothetical protein